MDITDISSAGQTPHAMKIISSFVNIRVWKYLGTRLSYQILNGLKSSHFTAFKSYLEF